MNDELLTLFGAHHVYFAVLLSLLVSVLVAVLGVVPSVFVTSANLLFFGFWQGLLLSVLGEWLGALAAFCLYRKGFRRLTQPSLARYPRIEKLLRATGKEAFLLLVSLRVLPLLPSGLVTFAAAVGRVSLPVFLLATLIGKLPALLMEAAMVQQVIRFSWQGHVFLLLLSLSLFALYRAHRRKSRVSEPYD